MKEGCIVYFRDIWEDYIFICIVLVRDVLGDISRFKWKVIGFSVKSKEKIKEWF